MEFGHEVIKHEQMNTHKSTHTHIAQIKLIN